MAPTAFMDPARPPAPGEIATALGARARLWEALTARLAEDYGIEPTLVPPSRNYGWDLKYRKGGRTIVSLTPDRGVFTALVVLGAAETDVAARLDLGDHVRRVYEDARQYHDGRWLYVQVESEQDVDDVIALVRLKRRPRAARAASTSS